MTFSSAWKVKSSMWTSYFEYFLRLIVMGLLLRVSYELEKPQNTRPNPLLATKAEEPFGTLSPLRQEWAEKSVAGYIRQQEKKWRRWDEAMFKAKYSPGS